ncbi:MAG: lysophospholipid acyltransferase family protein [Solidesulfovibrio sp.]
MQVTESRLRDLLRLIVWYPLRLVITRLPARVGLAILWGMARLHQALSGQRNARLLNALNRVAPKMPQYEARRQVGEFFRTHYANQLAIFLFPGLTRANYGQLLEIIGLKNLDAALGTGRGVVLAIGHFGPAQLPLTVLGLLGYPMLQIGFQNDNALTWIGRHVSFRLRQCYESRIPARIVPPGSGTRQAVLHLRAGGAVMTTADDAPGQPPFALHADFEFLGGRLHAPLGPARLALTTGAALLPAFLVPGEAAPYRLLLQTPISPPPNGTKDAAVLAMTREYLDSYASIISRFPGWWHALETRCLP